MSLAVIDDQPYDSLSSIGNCVFGVFLTQVFYVGRDFTKSAVGALINLFFASKADLFLSPE